VPSRRTWHAPARSACARRCGARGRSPTWRVGRRFLNSAQWRHASPPSSASQRSAFPSLWCAAGDRYPLGIAQIALTRRQLDAASR
jgi:hypothetical protein